MTLVTVLCGLSLKAGVTLLLRRLSTPNRKPDIPDTGARKLHSYSVLNLYSVSGFSKRSLPRHLNPTSEWVCCRVCREPRRVQDTKPDDNKCFTYAEYWDDCRV